jgi:glyoxylase-like metal-dependent hydrolase (beta-lactamase superfamily II)
MKLHIIKGYIQNIYLVEYNHGCLLLDGCCKADVPTITQFFNTDLKRPMSDLKLVVVTHMHPDHAGAAHALRKITGCRIATGRSKGAWYGGFQGKLMYITDVLLSLYVARRIGRQLKNLWYKPTLLADVILNEGDLLPDFEEWKVIETHGHTDRDISLWHLPTHRIYVADLVVKVREKYLTPWPIFHPNRYRSSVEKIKSLSPDYVLLAHGGEIKSPLIGECLNVHTPRLPRTHWRATKYRLNRILQRS